jgi:archaellum component FlaC
MKKRLVALLAGLLTVLSMGFGLAQFSDVPAGHWAKEAVEALAAKGILVGFPDGTYRGNENLTRYQAALIIYRLLQQIEEELKAKGESPTMEAMSSEDLEALKNAIQELAAELAALGVRVSALEDSAATKEDIARLEALIEELRAQPMPEVEPGMDQAALQDLLDRVEAASIAADTALAQAQQLAEQLEALAQAVEGVKDELAALATQVEANAQAIQALNELAALLNQDVLSLRDQVAALEKGAVTQEDLENLKASLEGLKGRLESVEALVESLASDLTDRVEAASIAADTALAQAQQLAEQLEALAQAVEGVKGDVAALATQVEANAQAIQALNELAVLLNQDVLSLQDRVTALEKGLADLQGVDFEEFATKEDVAAVQEFAAALRSDLVSLSEKVSKLEGQVAELNKVRYTISGSLSATYGSIGLLPGSTAGDFDVDRLFPGNKFSSGPSGPASRGNEYNFADTTQTFTGGGISLTLGVKLAQPGQTGVNLSEASVDLSATAFTGATTVSVDGATLKGNVDGQGFSVVYSNGASKFKFNDYLFANANDPDGVVTRQGVVATFSGSKLPLTPEVTVVAGNASSVAPNNVLNGDYFGVRLALKPLKDTTLALSYAENPGNRAAVALDFSTKKLLDLLDLDGAYVVSKDWSVPGTIFDNWGTPNVDEAFFVRGTLTLGPVTLRANYRAVDPDYLNGFAGMSADHTRFYSGEIIGFYPAPFGSNTRGYGAEASVNLGFATLGGYYDRYSDYLQNPGTEKEAFGANARVPLPAGFSLTGFYSYASVAGVQATFAGADPASNQGTPYFQFYAYPRDRYVSGFGAALSHDGRAKEALIPNLNLTARYQQYYNDVTGNYDYRDIVAFADYSLTLGPLTLKPGLFFRSYTNDNAGAAVPAGTSPSRPGAFTENPSFTTFKWGIQITTQPLDVPFKPSLEGYFATRTTDFDGTTSDAQETYYRVGLKLNEFLASGSTFSVGYAYWEGQNHAGSPAVGSAYNPFTFTRDRIFRNPDVSAAGAPWAVYPGNNSGNVSGVYLEWNYYTFSVAAGWFDFNNTGAGTSSSAIGFKVSYEVKF